MMNIEFPNVFFDIFDIVADPTNTNGPRRCRPNRGRSFRGLNRKNLRNTNDFWKYVNEQAKNFADGMKNETPLTTNIEKVDFTVTVKMDSFEPDEVAVKMENKYLIIHGKHEGKEVDGESESYEYTKKVIVPDNVVIEKMKCTMDENGNMVVVAPYKKPEKKVSDAHTIPIEIVKKQTETTKVGDQTEDMKLD
ncbi:hypothetical protein RDWZM_009704 [Blomia tropicalis]|uniref:SHSP domain-containing protein n=1 Tax=Blomia tropicalis TaxID=40697 RepID=A0A9Q0M5T1_BLOTA|nr:hypothetical protein BLOT_016424 [Blomia tropicalis]KAJ6218547.1 hypothetical protein RDWZM_009704 [Blomia tropicalis]